MRKIFIIDCEIPSSTNMYDLGLCLKEVIEDFKGKPIFMGEYSTRKSAQESVIFRKDEND